MGLRRYAHSTVVLVGSLAALGCCATRETPTERAMSGTPQPMLIHEALKVAVEELEGNKLMPRREYRLTASRVDDEWVFWFVFLPPTPGMDVTVFVADDGGTRVLPGL